MPAPAAFRHARWSDYEISPSALGARARGAAVVGPAQTDLDTFMQEVLIRRDDNWKKLQQYVLDERESMELRGPGQALLWGQRSDYTWYIRDGFFVRSPLKVNGATVGEADRRKYEADFLKREEAREKRSERRETRCQPPRPPPPTTPRGT